MGLACFLRLGVYR